MSQYLMHNYARLPISFVKGEGVYLYDQHHKRYLDALSGIAVCGLGHAHPELSAAIAEQAQRLWHVSNIFEIPEQTQAAETLCRLSGMQRAFFCNSGAEANEAAIKLTRLHAQQKSITAPSVIAFKASFHGRTFATMSATGNRNIQQGFEPLVEHFIHLDYNDINSLKALRDNNNIVAVMLECVQGEGGVNIADKAFVTAIRQLCDEQNWLMIVDEVQTGIGRSGQWFAYQHHNVLPDIITLAKGLGNGIPVGACLASGAAAELFQAGHHGSTFGGTPLVMAVVNKVLAIYERDNIPQQVNRLSAHLLNHLQQALGDHPLVNTIRGQGLLIGIELKQAIPDFVSKALAAGIVLNVTAEKVIRLLPALIMTSAQSYQLTAALQSLLDAEV